ncbi:hypothetical protein A9996_19185 [Gelidibacter algens]|nr:hypothetical protein A9996_19185 [Gelidibacter algens]
MFLDIRLKIYTQLQVGFWHFYFGVLLHLLPLGIFFHFFGSQYCRAFGCFFGFWNAEHPSQFAFGFSSVFKLRIYISPVFFFISVRFARYSNPVGFFVKWLTTLMYMSCGVF